MGFLKFFSQFKILGEVVAPTHRPSGCGQDGDCDRSKNEICETNGGVSRCVCPQPFQRNPKNGVCGGNLCNPDLPTSCLPAEICMLTPYNNHRCECRPKFVRRAETMGECSKNQILFEIFLKIFEIFSKILKILASSEIVTPPPPQTCSINPQGGCRQELNEVCFEQANGQRICGCPLGTQRNPLNNMCGPPGVCCPTCPSPCDPRKRQECLPDGSGFFVCQCPPTFTAHRVTGICLIDECAQKTDDCDANANCFNTDEGFLCSCKQGFLDVSPDRVNRPGRVCFAEINECATGTHNCSANANCINTDTGFLCHCKPGFIDNSPNRQFFQGTDCRPLVNECLDPKLNDCNQNATCIDTAEAYVCICKPGFDDMDEFGRPGRRCQERRALSQNNFCSQPTDCDQNADCLPVGADSFTCRCRAGYVDRSPNPGTRPGRQCIRGNNDS